MKKLRLGIFVNVFFIVLGISLHSCKTTRKVVESPSSVVKLKGEEVIQVFDSVMQKEFSFKYLSAKAKVSYTDKTGETNDFDINLRVKKDSIIWISITPLLGIEVVRVLIDKDSVYILDRLHKKYMKRNFSYFEDLLKSNVHYDMLEAVITGNYFQYLEKEKLRSLYEDEPYIILSTLNKRQARRAAEEKDPNKPVVQDFWIDGNYRIAKSRISDDKKSRWLEATYSNFTDVGGYLFPNNMVVTMASSTPAIIKIEYTKIMSEDSLLLPFSIPEKYTEQIIE